MAEFEVLRREKVDVRFLQVDADVRYWEDGPVNGENDSDDRPTMPFASANGWRPLIEVDTGAIVGWPGGTTAETHYKVCDAGRYSLLDGDRNVVFVLDNYVPSIMCPEGGGYGDYIIMKIGPDGKIANWTVDLAEFREASHG